MIDRQPSRGRLRTRLATTVTAVLCVTVVGSPASAAPPSAPAAVAAGVSWSACRDGFECASVPAPLDYDAPQGQQIGISVIRLPAGDPAQRVGSLFVNPGGPGGSGVDVVRAVAKALPLEVRAHFDIVGFDPRGTNRSTPLRCFDTLDEALAILPPSPYPDTPAEEDAQLASDDRLVAACTAHGGAVRDHMSTADVARDMDLLRSALGDEQLTYVGFSYGSVLGQTYANLFPGRIRALVIDAVVDPVAWSGQGESARTTPVGTRIGSAGGSESTLGEFFRLCDAAGPDCAFSGNASGRYAALGERLRGHPLTSVDPVTGGTYALTYNDVIATTVGALYAPAIWPDLALFLAGVEQQLAPAELGTRLATLRADLGLAAPAQEDYPNVVEAAPGVACADSTNPTTAEAWRSAADAAEARYGRFGRIWNWNGSACRSWPGSAAADRYDGPWTAHTSSPVLVVGNRFDPATPYAGAEAAAGLLPGSRLLTYAGWGHAAYLVAGNYCVDSHVTDYLVTGRLPAAGTVCQPEGTPFGPTEAASPAAAQVRAGLTAATVPAAVRDSVHAG